MTLHPYLAGLIVEEHHAHLRRTSEARRRVLVARKASRPSTSRPAAGRRLRRADGLLAGVRSACSVHRQGGERHA